MAKETNMHNFSPCSYLKEDETGKHKYDCEERGHPDTNMILENCFQDQGCCLNRQPKELPPSEYPESKTHHKKVTLQIDEHLAQNATFLLGYAAYRERDPESQVEAIEKILKRYSEINDICRGDLS